jgi:hypothetical protein
MDYNNQRKQKEEIITSQKLFWSFLDFTMLNKLVNLFDDTVAGPDKISKYIENERRIRGMDEASVVGKVYRELNIESDVLLEIRKNNQPILHLSLHLSPYSFSSKKTGPLHIYKNIYNTTQNLYKKKKYAIIRVEKPIGKDKSLEFSIAHGYKTPGINADEKEIQQEMDVIIHIINRIFDQYDPYYIGVEEELININPKTEPIVNNINNKSYVQLKNKGLRTISKINKTIPKLPIFYNKYHKTPKKRAASPKPRNLSRKVPANKPKID